MARTPDGPPPPPAVQKLRLCYAKRSGLRFSSHRDFQRALERALRRAGVPMAYSAGFSPHPKISYANSVPTGAASEAEYVEISLVSRRDPQAVRAALDAALPPGLDVLEVVEAGPGALADRLTGSVWSVELPGADPCAVGHVVADFLARDEVAVERILKTGRRRLDARAAVVALDVVEPPPGRLATVLHLVLRHLTPSVRPDDVVNALAELAASPAGGSADAMPPHLLLPEPARSRRLAQGTLDVDGGTVSDPLKTDREAVARRSTVESPVDEGRLCDS